MIWYPNHLWKSVFTHFWIGLLCSLPKGERLPRAICFAHIKAQNKPTTNWNTKHKPSCFPRNSFGQHLSNRKDVGSVVVWIMFWLSNTAIGYAHDVGPIPKPVLFVFFLFGSPWLILYGRWNLSLLPFVWLSKLWNHPSLGISIRTNSSMYIYIYVYDT